MSSLHNSIPATKEEVAPLVEDHADIRIYIPGANNDRRTKRNAQPNNVTSSEPLLPSTPKATLASPEVIDFNLEPINRAYPGVDDGFFSNGGMNDDKNDGNDNPDVELIPVNPDEVPELSPRFGGGEDDDDDEGKRREGGPEDEGDDEGDGEGKTAIDGGFGINVGGPGIPVPGTSMPDVNVYQHKKTLAQGMMDLALLSANANQLRYVLESYDRHPYFYPSLVLITISLLLQVAVGIGLIWNATYNIKDEKQICMANRVNNLTVSGIFLVTVVNVFVSAFGVANASPIK